MIEVETLIDQNNRLFDEKLKNQKGNTKALLIISELNNSLSELIKDDVSIDLNDTTVEGLLEISANIILLCKEIKEDRL